MNTVSFHEAMIQISITQHNLTSDHWRCCSFYFSKILNQQSFSKWLNYCTIQSSFVVKKMNIFMLALYHVQFQVEFWCVLNTKIRIKILWIYFFLCYSDLDFGVFKVTKCEMNNIRRDQILQCSKKMKKGIDESLKFRLYPKKCVWNIS